MIVYSSESCNEAKSGLTTKQASLGASRIQTRWWTFSIQHSSSSSNALAAAQPATNTTGTPEGIITRLCTELTQTNRSYRELDVCELPSLSGRVKIPEEQWDQALPQQLKLQIQNPGKGYYIAGERNQWDLEILIDLLCVIWTIQKMKTSATASITTSRIIGINLCSWNTPWLKREHYFNEQICYFAT